MTTRYGFLTLLMLCISLTASQAQAFLNANLNTPANAGIMSEGCPNTTYNLVLERNDGIPGDLNIQVTFSGDAAITTDFTIPAGSFPAVLALGDNVLVVPLTVISDANNEGLESLEINLSVTRGAETQNITILSGITDAYDVEIVSNTDTIEWCSNAPFTLNAVSDADIQWSPTFAFPDPTGSTVTAIPLFSGWYFATVGVDGCGDKDSIYFDLAIAEIAGPDTIYICNDGDGVTLNGSIDGLATTFYWTPADTTLSDPLSLNPVATPTVTTTYSLSSDFGICIASDTVVVRVDSLPDLSPIDIAPLKVYYCAGEIVALFSPTFDSLKYPDLIFEWKPSDDGTIITPLTLLNVAVELQDTTTYVRTNINNACRSQDSIKIDVVPSSVPLTLTDTTLCPGQMFEVEVLADNVQEPEWTPETGLSCNKCLDPKVTVIGTPGSTVFYQFSGKINDCPVGASLSVQIPPLQQINITGDDVACSGDVIPLTITDPSGLTDLNWSVTNGSASLSCTSCPDPVVTITGNDIVNISLTANTTNPEFCGSVGFFQIRQGSPANVVGPPIEVCRGGTAVVSTGDPELTNIVWEAQTGSGITLSCTSCPNPTITANTFGTLFFTAESPDPDICRVNGQVLVSFFDEDVVTFLVEPDSITNPIGQGDDVTVDIIVNPSNPASITWVVNGNTLNSTGSSVTFNASEENNVILATFINSNGCEQTARLGIGTVPPEYKIPNAFTPNNDDLNDHFRIIITGNILLEEFLIFNRWGQLVYEGPVNDDTGWDGDFKGQPAASDTYVFTAKLRLPDGTLKVEKGDVMLLK